MILFSPNLVYVFQNSPIEHFYLLKIWRYVDGVEEVVERCTTTGFDLLMTPEGGGDPELYEANNRLVGLDTPQSNSTVDREQFKVVISDNEFAAGPYLENGLIGCKAEARIGFFKDGVPLTDMADTILSYAGRVDGVGYLVKTEEQGEGLLEITCASPMADLEMKKGVFLSKDFVRGRNPSDSSCDQIYGGSSAVSMKWGKG